MEQGTTVFSGTQSRIEARFEDARIVLRKIATREGSQEIREQVELLRALPPDLASHYPELLAYDLESEPAWYSMPCYPYPSARWLQVYSECSADTMARALERVVEFLFCSQHAWRNATPGPGYLAEQYLDRPRRRLSEMRGRHPLFGELTQASEIVLEGEPMRGPLVILDALSAASDLLQSMAPSSLCSAHGQVEFEHILIDPSGLAQPGFILLDARGLKSLDPAYDAGKLLQSARGKIDWLEEDLFELGPLTTGQGYVSVDYLTFKRPERVVECDRLSAALVAMLLARTGPAFRAVMDLAEAAHLLGAVPFCYREGDVDRAVACFLIGTRALNRFADLHLTGG